MKSEEATSKKSLKLFSQVDGYMSDDKVAIVAQAYEYSAKCHIGQTRLSGAPYIEHPLQTALFLADLKLDQATVSAALLHDVMEDCEISYNDLELEFGKEIAKLVDGVTKLTRMDLFAISPQDDHPLVVTDVRLHAESLRKMLVAMAEDIRVVLIKLADRLHNMRTLQALPKQRRQAIAQETMEIYAPLAHRLGMWDMKWKLEDMSFRHLQPSEYREISKILASSRKERESYVSEATKTLKQHLTKGGIKSHVTGRPKSIYSTYQKVQKYASQGKDQTDIYDLYALRVLVKTMTDCYNSLGIVHNLWRPIPGQFDDYIATPKDNFYQALHTTVMCEGEKPLEVQIRTYEMHHVAETGVAAHWRYKEGEVTDIKFEEKMNWLRQLLEWQREVSGAEEFMDSVKTDILRDQVFLYTPKGDIIELPTGATPVDFAYKIHTELGHTCMGAKINGKLVALDYRLKNSDAVEIITSNIAQGPPLEWLNPDLGLACTASARSKIRQWFRKQERSTNIRRGRELLSKELQRLNMTFDEIEIARMFKHDTPEDFLVLLGSGGTSVNQLLSKLTSPQKQRDPSVKIPFSIDSSSSGVQLLGTGDMLICMGTCCSPIPGDEIMGFITRNTSVTVHKKDCSNLHNEDEKEYLVNVKWSDTRELYPVRIHIVSWDRVGLLKDISTLVSDEGVNIASVITNENTDGTVTVEQTLHTSGISQLSRLFYKLEGVRGVISATRSETQSNTSSRS